MNEGCADAAKDRVFDRGRGKSPRHHDSAPPNDSSINQGGTWGGRHGCPGPTEKHRPQLDEVVPGRRPPALSGLNHSVAAETSELARAPEGACQHNNL